MLASPLCISTVRLGADVDEETADKNITVRMAKRNCLEDILGLLYIRTIKTELV